MKFLVSIVFILYLFVLCLLLFFDIYFVGRPNRSYMSLIEYVQLGTINLIPFQTLKFYFMGGHLNQHTMIIQLVGNFVLFMPFSLFLPILFAKCRDIKFFIKLLLLINVAVEIMQVLLRVGSFDIDTIILNSGGSILVYILFIKWGPKLCKNLNLQHKDK